MLIRKIIQKKIGQTLIEILLVAGFLVMVVAAAYILSSQAIKSGSLVRQKEEATVLASDALEKITNIRDTNLKNGDDFAKDFPSPSGTSKVEYKDPAHPEEGFKLESAPSEVITLGSDSFRREIDINVDLTTRIIKVKVTVRYGKSYADQVILAKYLTDWKKQP